jgi:acetyl esterase/lipase
MKWIGLALTAVILIGCEPAATKPAANRSAPPPPPPPPPKMSLADARRGFQTKLVRQEKTNQPVDSPPSDIFRIVQYDSPVGKLAAYLSPDPEDGKKHPAILWITGGDCNSIGEVWGDAPAENDQTASAFREAGMIMMFPSLRGGNENPGVKEAFLGEVDDVLAAADFLAKQPGVDPDRIYLGGHSTGGTMVLLVAECSPRFRGVFSFGPVADVSTYDPKYLVFDRSDRREVDLRSPLGWLDFIASPVFVIEGTVAPSNLSDLEEMSHATTNPNAHFCPVNRATHFSILAPATKLLAEKIVHDDGPKSNITLTADELDGLMPK